MIHIFEEYFYEEYSYTVEWERRAHRCCQEIQGYFTFNCIKEIYSSDKRHFLLCANRKLVRITKTKE